MPDDLALSLAIALSALKHTVAMERRCMCGPGDTEMAREAAVQAGATDGQIEEAMR